METEPVVEGGLVEGGEGLVGGTGREGLVAGGRMLKGVS